MGMDNTETAKLLAALSDDAVFAVFENQMRHVDWQLPNLSVTILGCEPVTVGDPGWRKALADQLRAKMTVEFVSTE